MDRPSTLTNGTLTDLIRDHQRDIESLHRRRVFSSAMITQLERELKYLQDEQYRRTGKTT